ncbi:unnamed protein product (macronuclear) [Paramecium tetraurelia]|nr:uncharacterized protein GSPATT00039194001 [Paramecium tetraurelia]CAK77060.1 unnamed protein product [Paramecium tetraurelia]|eukprot:XP_001444457.1 hypothetical protein (macronuclear) [Paramecium tetraurelia strain d4-2]
MQKCARREYQHFPPNKIKNLRLDNHESNITLFHILWCLTCIFGVRLSISFIPKRSEQFIETIQCIYSFHTNCTTLKQCTGRQFFGFQYIFQSNNFFQKNDQYEFFLILILVLTCRMVKQISQCI